MGELKRTENSLNQHIKLKHKEFWEQLKYTNEIKESEAAKSKDDQIEIRPDFEMKQEDKDQTSN